MADKKDKKEVTKTEEIKSEEERYYVPSVNKYLTRKEIKDLKK